MDIKELTMLVTSKDFVLAKKYGTDTLAQCSKENIDTIISLATASPEGCFVECGVALGGTAAVLLKLANEQKRKLFLCDSFKGFPKPGKYDMNNTPFINEGDGNGATISRVKEVFSYCNLESTNISFVEGFFSETMPKLKTYIPPIAFLHFDGDFYQSTIDVFDNLLEKVVSNGIVMFHDYPFFEGVKRAVEERFKLEDVHIANQNSGSQSGYIIKR
jgi:hypothetical protein